MRVLVVGGGKVGSFLASILLDGGHAVTLIEQDAAKAARLTPEFKPGVVVTGGGTDPAVLEAVGARRAEVLAAVTGADETNLVAASLARFEFNIPRIIARVNNPKNAWLFTPEMGVDVALNQADLMAHLIAEEMSLGDMLTLLKLRKGQFALVEEKVDARARAVGQAVSALALPEQCVLVAVIRKGELLLPRPALVLQPVDEVLALVHASEAKQLAALLGAPGSGR